MRECDDLRSTSRELGWSGVHRALRGSHGHCLRTSRAGSLPAITLCVLPRDPREPKVLRNQCRHSQTLQRHALDGLLEVVDARDLRIHELALVSRQRRRDGGLLGVPSDYRRRR